MASPFLARAGRILAIGAGLFAVVVGARAIGLLPGRTTARESPPLPAPDVAALDRVLTAATVAAPLATVRARLVAALQGDNGAETEKPALGPQFRAYAFLTNERGNIDGQFRATPDGGYSSDASLSLRNLDPAVLDPAIPRYLALPEAARAADLEILRGGPNPTPRWTAPEYQKAGAPLPYSSEYFIHLRETGPGQTQIGVIGWNARVTDGQKWKFDQAGFPTWPYQVDNNVLVVPAPSDKQAVLARLVALAGAE